VGGEQRGQHRDRLGGDDGQQPGAADPLRQRGLLALDRKRGEDGVGERQPEHGRDGQQYHRDRELVGDQDHLGAEHAGRGNGSEEAEPTLMTGQILENALRVEAQA
jgi:hypothetical protein